MSPPGGHEGQPILQAGVPLEKAGAAAVLVHGRGASADDILFSLAPVLDLPGFAFLAPQAAGGVWYPNPFTAPLESNQPWLDSALERLGSVLAQVEEHVPAERVMLLGFSQGACLTLEFAARNARRYGAVVGLSGALIGPPETERDYPGSLAGTPVLLSSGDPDPYFPVNLVEEAGTILGRLGADVRLHIYPGLGHTINAEEVADVRNLMAALSRREEEVHP